MVGNADIQAEQGGERAQQALGLPPRPTKAQAQQVPGLDRHVRVIPRPPARPRGGGAPGRDRLGRAPDRQAPPPLQRPVVFRPVLDPVARPWDLVAARLIEPVGHRASSRRGSGPISLRRRPAQARERHFCTNAAPCGISAGQSFAIRGRFVSSQWRETARFGWLRPKTGRPEPRLLPPAQPSLPAGGVVMEIVWWIAIAIVIGGGATFFWVMWQLIFPPRDD